jgi:hypothetical protein
MNLLAEGLILKFSGAGKLCHDISLSVSCFQAQNYVSFCFQWSCCIKIHLQVHILATINGECLPTVVSVPQWPFGEHHMNTASGNWNLLLPEFAPVKWKFFLLMTADEYNISSHHFINMILVSLTGCCLWSPAMLLVTHAACLRIASQTHTNQRWTIMMSTQSSSQTTLICWRTSISGIFYAVNSSNTACCIFQWCCLLTLHHFCGCHSDISNGRNMTLHTTACESLTEWVQFTSHCYVSAS